MRTKQWLKKWGANPKESIGGMKLHLGCGYEYIKGFINIDCYEGCKPDIVLDLSKIPYPFKDNSVGYIYSFHCIEHIPQIHIKKVLNELYRISKHNAIWDIHVPYYNCTTQGNIDHHTTFGFDSFNFIETNHMRNYYAEIKGEVLSVEGVPTIVGKWIPTKKLRQYVSYFIGHIIRGLYFKIRIIKEDSKK